MYYDSQYSNENYARHMPHARMAYNNIKSAIWDGYISGARKEATPRLQIMNKGKK